MKGGDVFSRNSLFVLLASPLFVACAGSIFTVSSKANGGIQFYPIEQFDAITTTALESIYGIELQTKVTPVKGTARTSTRNYFTSKQACLEELVKAFDGPNGDVELRAVLGSRLCSGYTVSEPEPKVLSDWSSLHLIGQGRERRSRPSRSSLYVNVERPRVGSSTAALKFASNGTLTEASATVDDKLIEHAVAAVTGLAGTTVTALPINALLTKRWNLTPATSNAELLEDRKEFIQQLTGEPPVSGDQVEMTLRPTKRFRLYVKVIDDSCQPANAPGCVLEQRVQDIPTAQKDETSKVEFAGSVKLPSNK